MSAKHPIIAITGSSGAGTTTVKILSTVEKIDIMCGATTIEAHIGVPADRCRGLKISLQA